jgi:F-type H+-transporting ATPase subunit epsilon
MFKLNLMTPEKKVVADQELDEITVPAFKGELNILPGHAPLMTTLQPGILSYKLKNGESLRMAIGWGYCQVSPEAVNVLAELAFATDEIDVRNAQEKLKTEESRLVNEMLTDLDWNLVQHEIDRLKAELELAGGAKTH